MPEATFLFEAVWYALAASACLYAIAGVSFTFGLWRQRSSVPETADLPFVSVVIAARNEEKVLATCLERLIRQTMPADRYEVLVIDDNSDDDTGEIIRTFAEQHPVVRGLRTGNAFPNLVAKKRPMAVGIAEARGEIILTTDADCRVPSTWVSTMATSFGPDTGIVIGYSQLKARGSHLTWFERLQGLDFLALMSAAAGSARLGMPLAVSGQNFAYRKSLYEQVGGFTSIGHRASGDDVLLLQLMRKCEGWQTAFADDPAANVSTWRSETMAGFWEQRRRWASNASLQLKLNPGFFIYLTGVFCISALVPLGLAVESLREVAIATWATRAGTDLLVTASGAIRFGRRDLLVAFPLWEILQIPYVFLIGIAGAVTGFSWKGTHYAPQGTDPESASDN